MRLQGDAPSPRDSSRLAPRGYSLRGPRAAAAVAAGLADAQRYLPPIDPERLIRTADDLGTQQLLMMSPATYRKVLKSFHRRYFALIRQYTDAKIFFHSDGNVVDLLDDLIESGVEVLNPVQVSAIPEPERLKERFGHRLAFWGGTGSHVTLPRGTTEDVAEEVALRARQFATEGGYVIAPAHNVQADVPPQNILAMCDAARAKDLGAR
ncbi:MAG TPA: uroporphyrinogen decarboxylase family protein [Acidimicrobiales bacterium]|nr:uroporphyrinogen decarboxylase family protein [Acidimicrobiales bacterium]